MRVSYGKGDLGRIYEKLRKRSYRRYWVYPTHEAYVRGVREALEEVDSLAERAYTRGFEDGLMFGEGRDT